MKRKAKMALRVEAALRVMRSDADLAESWNEGDLARQLRTIVLQLEDVKRLLGCKK